MSITRKLKEELMRFGSSTTAIAAELLPAKLRRTETYITEIKKYDQAIVFSHHDGGRFGTLNRNGVFAFYKTLEELCKKEFTDPDEKIESAVSRALT